MSHVDHNSWSQVRCLPLKQLIFGWENAEHFWKTSVLRETLSTRLPSQNCSAEVFELWKSRSQRRKTLWTWEFTPVLFSKLNFSSFYGNAEVLRPQAGHNRQEPVRDSINVLPCVKETGGKMWKVERQVQQNSLVSLVLQAALLLHGTSCWEEALDLAELSCPSGQKKTSSMPSSHANPPEVLSNIKQVFCSIQLWKKTRPRCKGG